MLFAPLQFVQNQRNWTNLKRTPVVKGQTSGLTVKPDMACKMGDHPKESGYVCHKGLPQNDQCGRPLVKASWREEKESQTNLTL